MTVSRFGRSHHRLAHASPLPGDQRRPSAPKKLPNPVDSSRRKPFSQSRNRLIENGGHTHVVHAANDLSDARLTDISQNRTRRDRFGCRTVRYRTTFIFHSSGSWRWRHWNLPTHRPSNSAAASLQYDPGQLASLAAHEFFHLWKCVKRIRPTGLWPRRLHNGKHTRALWFSEGVPDG